ncbi:MAG: septal ring lytic transglycosylase RlpA family protein [Melioribacteraceae bacterium]|nr:septal ring lytic transglycosylase RlpA family protein [Melioribacteraceae bacterium]
MKIKLLYIFITALLFSGCASSVRFTAEKDSVPNHTEHKSPETNYDEFNNYEAIESVTGIASFYASKFHGRQTANGEIYNMYNLTAAHENYPFGTIIKVTNLNNNKSATIRINDRMPFHPQRIIDLSYGTALELDMIKDGIVNVRLDILKWGEE